MREVIVLFAFTSISTLIIRKVAGESADLLMIASVILPIVSYIITLYFIQATMLIRLLFDLILLPFKLFGIGRKKDTKKEKYQDVDTPRSFGLSAIIISGLLYWGVGNFLINSRSVEFPLKVFIGMGLIWGVLLYIGYQDGSIEDMESEY